MFEDLAKVMMKEFTANVCINVLFNSLRVKFDHGISMI